MNLLQSWLQVLTICAFLAGAMFYQGKRIDDLGRRIDDLRTELKDLLRSEVKRVEELIHAEGNERRSEVKRLEDRFDRLEHPVHQQ